MISRVLFVVPIDFDCGRTVDRIRQALRFEELDHLCDVLPAHGHHSCGALNQGLHFLQAADIKYVAIVSNKVIEHVNQDVLETIACQLNAGNLVVGVKIQELADVEELPIENTFAVWDVEKLLSVGGFDSEIGVEEIAPIVKLVKMYGACVSVIQPKTGVKLNIRQSEDGKARHAEVKSTKGARQLQELQRMDISLEKVRRYIHILPIQC